MPRSKAQQGEPSCEGSPRRSDLRLREGRTCPPPALGGGWGRVWGVAGLVAAAFIVAGPLSCGEDDEPTYVQFNADDDELTVEVGADEVGPAETIDLHSTTGEVVIGTASVDPDAGPIGTEHVIRVQIDPAYENIVDKVTVRTDSDARGEDEYDLVADSADEGFYKLTIVSVGAEDEHRTDTLTIKVWDVEDDDDGEPGSSGDDTGDTGGDTGDDTGGDTAGS